MRSVDRIEILDGFRCIAIISVLLYHFYYRWAPPLSPVEYYHYEYIFFIFRYGHYGVEMFFVISGFVIFYSLEKSSSLYSFLYKRFIRLFPALLLCTFLTYFLVYAFDPDNKLHFRSTTPLNLLPSLTFIPSSIWQYLFGRDDIGYINGSYWSLWPEVVFYVASGFVYFTNQKSFLSVWLKLVLTFTFIRIISSTKNQWLFNETANFIFQKVTKSFFFFGINYWVYFSLGTLFYSLFSKKKISGLDYFIIIILVALELFFLPNYALRFLLLAVIGLFIIFIYRENYLKFLKLKIIAKIGLISYSLYLIHEVLGVILINKLSYIIGIPSFNKFIPVLVILTFIIISSGIYKYYEVPIAKYLKNLNKLKKVETTA
jgi:peptidoglycan/LPS O-acetylase OafA/YrhL